MRLKKEAITGSGLGLGINNQLSDSIHVSYVQSGLDAVFAPLHFFLIIILFFLAWKLQSTEE